MAQEPFDKPGAWARFRNWLSHVHFRIVTIEDTPHSIALGVAIGIFFGFTPLWSLKTLLSIAVAWLCKSNKIAAAISVQLHDLILPFMPAIYLWEYKFGYWTMHGRLPQRLHFPALGFRDYAHWADTLFSRSAAAHRLAHHWIAIGGDRLFCLPRPGYEPPGRANERVGD